LRDYIQGLLWFVQHDADLPAEFRARTLEWRLAADEYTDNDHWPRQVYVREGRRIRAHYTFTAHDAVPAPDSPRPPIHRGSVTASHYPIDCRETLQERLVQAGAVLIYYDDSSRRSALTETRLFERIPTSDHRHMDLRLICPRWPVKPVRRAISAPSCLE
jgi:hypothetical protein